MCLISKNIKFLEIKPFKEGGITSTLGEVKIYSFHVTMTVIYVKWTKYTLFFT
jgi:hypothetical protein